ncbi:MULTISPECIES: hypothetical protein [Streptacidiphilus]|uniref:Uncharacterized protein n=1 Tax=Streptacidiphilus cavernicola TaxID=3342716 RepID=A0ABV6UTS4_9ACTN|nr:hypothetical protein [Streptacidiphilus jeojiense]
MSAGGPFGLLVLLLAVLSALLLPVTGAEAAAKAPRAGSQTIDPTIPTPTAAEMGTDPGTTGGTSCGAGGSSWLAYSGATQVRLKVSLPALPAVNGLWSTTAHVWDTDGSSAVDVSDSDLAGGETAYMYLNLPLVDGHTYGWYAQIANATASSPESVSCYFTVDAGWPSTPLVSSTDFPSLAGVAPVKSANQLGTFDISGSKDPLPSGCTSASAPDCKASGLAYYLYSVDSQPGSGSPQLTPDDCGNASLGLSFGWGTHTLFVTPIDKAGLRGGTVQYTFYVSSQTLPPAPASTPPPACTTYVPVAPTRVLDTRSGTGGFNRPLGAGGSLALPVAGRAGVPSSGVGAVVLNVTATGATLSSWMSVYPDGQPRPTVSNLNFGKGRTVANLVTVPVVDGQVDLYNAYGSVNAVADLVGYYTTAATGSTFVSSGPTRVLDTRTGTGTPKQQLAAGKAIPLQIAGVNGAPEKVTAVAMNVTATGSTQGGYITAYPDGQARPTTSTVNFAAKQTTPNLAIVPVVDGKIDFYNGFGSVDVVADITGYFTGDDTGAYFYPTVPTRLLDTRNGTGGFHKPVSATAGIALPVAGQPPVPATGVSAVVMNVTVTGATLGGWLAVCPDGQGKPTTSTLNFTPGQTVANLSITPMTDGKVDFFNGFGTVNVIADLAGYFSTS